MGKWRRNGEPRTLGGHASQSTRRRPTPVNTYKTAALPDPFANGIVQADDVPGTLLAVTNVFC